MLIISLLNIKLSKLYKKKISKESIKRGRTPNFSKKKMAPALGLEPRTP